MSSILLKIHNLLHFEFKPLIIYIGYKINNLRVFDCNFYTKVAMSFLMGIRLQDFKVLKINKFQKKSRGGGG